MGQWHCRNCGDLIYCMEDSGNAPMQRATMPRMTTPSTTRMLLSELNPHRYRPEPHCITCLDLLVPTDRVEFVTPEWVTVGPSILILWHANEVCATSTIVARYLDASTSWAAFGRSPWV